MCYFIKALYFLVFIIFSICYTKQESSFDVLELLIINPYQGQPFGAKRSHEEVAKLLGSVPNETFYPNKSEEIPVHVVRSKLTIGEYTPLLITLASNPVKSFSVYPPLFEGGCKGDYRTRTSVTSRFQKCVTSTNAGFFNMNDGECYGNLISDGKILQAPGLQNVNFGVRKDGSIVTGYLSKESVTSESNPFLNLIAGLVWLVRKGKNYVDESLKIENMTFQTTGDSFATVLSARTAVGHDAKGRIFLVQVDGKTGKRGINLYDLADYLIEIGLVNAVNLDGGGSSTFVVNGTLANAPSDECTQNPFNIPDSSCERKVTSIICIHDDSQQELNCSAAYSSIDWYKSSVLLALIVNLMVFFLILTYNFHKNKFNPNSDVNVGMDEKDA
jgi:hypothetical protein